MKKISFYWLLVMLLLIGFLDVTAQEQDEYYKVYDKHLVLRTYLSKKYTSYRINSATTAPSLRYVPNKPGTIGVGATYGPLTLNVDAGLGFLNDNTAQKGKTKSLDLQTSIYNRKWIVDIFGQFYKGYYLKNTPSSVQAGYYIRPDMKARLVGVSGYYIFNNKQFSYRAGFLQNEIQLKSAGSFLLGGQLYTNLLKADSALVPAVIQADYSQGTINKVAYTGFGPGAGYAYTYVLQKNFFATGSMVVNANVNIVKETGQGNTQRKTTITPNTALKAVLGYNNARWTAAVSWTNTSLKARGEINNQTYVSRVGNIRLTLARRILPEKNLKKTLDVLPAVN